MGWAELSPLGFKPVQLDALNHLQALPSAWLISASISASDDPLDGQPDGYIARQRERRWGPLVI